MQQPVTPKPGQTPGPNLVNDQDYKMHILKREYAANEYEILIERWTPESGWTRTQLLLSLDQLDKFRAILAD